eukprot:860022-Rhodomonas_salina.2
MGKRNSSGGGKRGKEKGDGRGASKRARQEANTEAGKQRARLIAQRTRLERGLARAGKDKEAQLAVHEDAVRTYREYMRCDEEWVSSQRLVHLRAIFELAPDSEKAKVLREELVLSLLDEGEAAEARQRLESWSVEKGTAFAWSRALVELVAWKGGEEGATRDLVVKAIDEALVQNQYVGVFLSFLDTFTREIDPETAPQPGRKPGTVEEALAYACAAGGCWLDFNEDGSVSELVGERVGEIDVVWPPTSEGGSERYRKMFVEACEIAEKEVEEEDEGEDAEEGGEEEEEEGEGDSADHP